MRTRSIGITRCRQVAARAVFAAALTATPVAQEKPVRVLVQTELGDIVVEVDRATAPATAANFLKYVDAGHYDGGTWHRTVKMASTISRRSTSATRAIPTVRGSPRSDAWSRA
jgi:hypothetical protein